MHKIMYALLSDCLLQSRVRFSFILAMGEETYSDKYFFSRSCVSVNTLSELSNYSAMYTKTHYVMNIPIYGAHTQLIIFPTPNINGEVIA